MFAIAFDLCVVDVQANRPKGVSQAYADIRSTLAEHGFDWVQGSLYVSRIEDMAVLFRAIMALKGLPGSHPRSGTFVRSGSSSGRTSRRS